MYRCENCAYSKFNYNKKWRLQNIFCNRLGDYLSVVNYRKLRFCLFYKVKGV